MIQTSGLTDAPTDISIWRKQTRKDLIDLRLQASTRDRRIWSRQIGLF